MRQRHRRFGRGQCGKGEKPKTIVIGIILLLAGGLLLLRQFGYIIPGYVFSWQMLLICIGLLVGATHGYRGFGWAIPIIVGTVFLAREYVDFLGYEGYVVPVMLLGLGAFIVLRNLSPRRNNAITGDAAEEAAPEPASFTNTGWLEATAVFGGINKNVISKDFRKGEVSAVFGSAEINMLQADFQDNAKLELNAVFGSIKLIVPAHWNLKIESNAVLGGVEDRRPQHSIYSDKVLLIEGNAVFGGIQIESH